MKNIKLLSKEAHVPAPVATVPTTAAVEVPPSSVPAVAAALTAVHERSPADAFSSAAPLQEGDKVEGNFRGRGKWFAATVDRVRPDGTFDLDYEDGEHERRVEAANVRRPQPKVPEPAAPEAAEAADGPLKEGDKVEGNYRGKGKWHPATVDRVRADSSVDLDYEDGEHEIRVTAANVRRPGSVILSPVEPTLAPLQEGDKVEGNYRGKGKWYPGKIDRIRADGSFDIDYDDGEHEVRVSAENVRRPGAAPVIADANQSSSEPSPVPVVADPPFREGDKVEGNYHGKGKWYPATVKAVSSKGKLNLSYDDGTKEHHVEVVRVRHLPSAATALDSSAQAGETVKPVAGFAVGQKVLGDYRGKNRWYPAKVAAVNSDGTYDIDYDDGEKESNLRAERLRAVEESAVQHSFQLGDKVSVMYANSTRAFPAQITKAHADGTFDVRYDDGETERGVAARKISPRVPTPLKAPAPASVADTAAASPPVSLQEGDKVEGNYRGKGKWYPARISRVNLDGTYNLDYDDGEKETRVSYEHVRAVGGAAQANAMDAAEENASHLREGDKVEGNYRGKGRWYPARIKAVHRDGTIDVNYDDGEQELGVDASNVRALGGRRPSHSAARESPPLQEGDKVEVNYRDKGRWYPARIRTAHRDGTFDIDYDDGEKERDVSPSCVRSVGQKAAPSRSNPDAGSAELHEGEKVEGNYHGRGKWYPARVMTVNPDGTYDIDYDNGERASNVDGSNVRAVCQKVVARGRADSESLYLQEGDKVEGNYRGKGRWYPGRITRVHADGTYNLDYDDGEKETRLDADRVRAVGDGGGKTSVRAPRLQEGDRVEGNYRGKGRWYPGRISRVNVDGSFNVDYDDGEKETRLDANLVRVVGGAQAKGPQEPLRFQDGEKVEGNYRSMGKWNPARVGHANRDGTYNLDYDDGEREARVTPDHVRAPGAEAKAPTPGVDPTHTGAPSLRQGAKVEGNYRGKGRWYPARVRQVNDDGSMDIDYDDGERERGVDASMVRVLGHQHDQLRASHAPETDNHHVSAPHSHLAEGDKVEGNYRGKGKWYPARLGRVHHDGTYNIDYDDGEKESRVSHENIRAVAKMGAAKEIAVAEQAGITPLAEGDKVEGNYRGKGKWYPATIDRVRQDGSADLDYDDGEKEARVTPAHVRRPTPVAAPAASKASNATAAPAEAATTPAAPLLEGDRVEADYRAEGTWLQATIDRIRTDGTFDLDFDNGAREVRVATALVRRPSAAAAVAAAPAVMPEPEVPRPILEGDEVEGNYRGKGKWFPATVDRVRADGSFDLDYDDGEREARMDSANVRHRGTANAARVAASASAPAATASSSAPKPISAMSFEEMRRAPTVTPPPVGARAEPTPEANDVQPLAPTPSSPAALSARRPEKPTASFTSPLKFGRSYRAEQRSAEKAAAEEPVAANSATPAATTAEAPAHAAKACAPSRVNIKVAVRETQANYRNKGIWLAITHVTERENGVFDVVYEDGDVEKGLIPDRIFPPPALSETALVEEPPFAWGQRVEVNYHNKGVWLPAAVANVHPNGTVDVDYADGETETNIAPRLIRALADAGAPIVQGAHSPVAPGGARRPQRPTPNRAQSKTGTSTDSSSAAATPRKQVRYGNDVKGGSDGEDGADKPVVTIATATTTSDAELASMMDLQFFNDGSTGSAGYPQSPTATTASDPKASPGGSVGSIRWDESVDFELSDDEGSPKQARHAHK
jgi:DUF971 family protein